MAEGKKFICRKIDDTDYFYFAPEDSKDFLLFHIHCDNMDYFVGEAYYNEIMDILRTDDEVEMTIVFVI